MKEIDFTGRYEIIILDFRLAFLLIISSKESLIGIQYLLFEKGIINLRDSTSHFIIYIQTFIQQSVKFSKRYI